MIAAATEGGEDLSLLILDKEEVLELETTQMGP